MKNKIRIIFLCLGLSTSFTFSQGLGLMYLNTLVSTSTQYADFYDRFLEEPPVFVGLADDYFISQRAISDAIFFEVNPGLGSPLTESIRLDTFNLHPQLIPKIELEYPLFLSSNQASLIYTLSGTVGVAEIRFVATNPAGESTEKTIRIHILQTIPLALGENFEVNEDGLLIGDVTLNDLDEDTDNQDLGFMLIEDVQHGTLTHQTNGTFEYRPDTDFFGEDHFSYRIYDDLDTSEIVQAAIIVKPINDPPQILSLQDTLVLKQNDDLKTYPFEAFPGPSNENDQELIFEIIPSQLNLLGDLNIEDLGSTQYELKFRPLGIPGELTLQIIAKDTDAANPEGIDSVLVTVDVIIIQNIPIALDDSYTLSEDQTLEISSPNSILNNDLDQDTDKANLSAILSQNPQHGSLTLNPEGTFTYIPTENYFGTDSFRYQTSDGEDISDTATVLLTIDPVNDIPLIENLPDTIFVKQNAGIDSLDFQVNAGDILENDQILSLSAQSLHPELIANPFISLVGGQASMRFPIIGQPGIAQILINLNDNGGRLNGGKDSTGAAFYIKIIQNIPLAISDTFYLAEDTPFTNNSGILNNDLDEDHPSNELTAELISNAAQGLAQLEPNGIFTYTPNLNFNGLDSFSYRVRDPEGNSDTSFVLLSVSPVNDAPFARNDTFNILEDSSLADVNIRENDQDPDHLLNQLTVQLIQAPLQTNFSLNTDGSLTYTPSADFYGVDSLIYQLNDGDALSNLAIVWIVTNAQNDPPQAFKDSLSVLEDSTLIGNVLINDLDIENDALTTNLLRDVQSGILVFRADGTFEYKPNKDFEGIDSFTYETKDQNSSSEPALVTITVLPVNDPPKALPDTYATLEDRPLLGASLWDNDLDIDIGDKIESGRIVTSPNHGTIELNDTTGTFIYIPNSDYFGTDEFFYVCSDGEADAEPTRVLIQINPVIDAPVAQADNYQVFEDQLYSDASILDNDSDVDTPNISAILRQNTQHGQLTLDEANGTFTYLPNAEYVGEDSFIYQAYDGELFSDSVRVTLFVQAVNDPPQILGLSDTLRADLDDGLQFVEFDLQTGFGEENQTIAALTASALEPEVLTDVTIIVLDGKRARLEFRPLRVDTTNIEIYIKDNGGIENGGFDNTTFTLNVVITQGLLIPLADKVELKEDQLQEFDINNTLRNNDFFGLNRNPEIIISQNPAHVILTLTNNGKIQYQPQPNYFGEDQFKYRLKLGDRLSEEEALVSLEIMPINDAPEIDGLPENLSLGRNAGIQIIPFRLTVGPLEKQDFEDIDMSQSNERVLTGLNLYRVTDSTAELEFSPFEPGISNIEIRVRDNGGVLFGGVDNSRQTIRVEVYEVAPAGVGLLRAVAPNFTEINLDWDDITANEEGFVIERAFEDETDFEVIGQVNEDITRFADLDLQTGISKYCYRIKAINFKGDSPYSNIACAVRRNNEILLPNTFTPNGDKRNDFFILRSLNVEEVDFNIYDRNGNIVFRTQDVAKATTEGWDGGNQPPGVYVWSVRVKFDDGIEKNAQGKINLVR